MRLASGSPFEPAEANFIVSEYKKSFGISRRTRGRVTRSPEITPRRSCNFRIADNTETTQRKARFSLLLKASSWEAAGSVTNRTFLEKLSLSPPTDGLVSNTILIHCNSNTVTMNAETVGAEVILEA